MKKVLSWLFGGLICAAILLCLLPQLATPAEAATYSGTCGSNLTWELDTETGELIISGSGAMQDYSSVSGRPWHSYIKIIKTVTIGNGVTSIGDYAFCDCSLTSVTIGDGVTSIGDCAFYYCSLTSVTIGDGVTSIGDSAFRGCTGLTSVTIGDGVTSIGDSAFRFCCNLTTVTIGDSVTSIGVHAFYECTFLVSVSISDSVTSIGASAFGLCDYLCHVLYEGTKDQWNAIAISSNNSELKDAFRHYQAFGNEAIVSKTCDGEIVYCSLCDTVVYHDGFGASHSFSEGICTACSIPEGLEYYMVKSPAHIVISDYTGSAQQLDIPVKIAGLPVKSIGNMAFYKCTSLTSVTIPDGVTSIGDYAFCDCSLTSVTIPASVTAIGADAFSRSGIERVDITDISAWCGISFAPTEGTWHTGAADYANYRSNPLVLGAGLYLNGELVEDLVIPRGVSRIKDRAFTHYEFLKSVMIPDSMISIDYNAFHGCNLTSVYITDVAAWCKIDFENEYSNPLRCGADLYLNGNYAEHLMIPDKVTSIGDYAFCKYTNLISVTIPDSVTSIGDCAFRGCSGLTSVMVPDSVTSIGEYAFADCTSLTLVTIGDNVTSIGDYAFRGCTSLTSVTIPDSVTNIGNYAFSDCASLTLVTIGDSVSSIGDYAFRGCTSLTSVSIPDSVSSIGTYAFDGCDSLCHVFYEGTEEQWGSIAISSYNSELKAAFRHYEAIGNEVTFSETCVSRYAYCRLCDAVVSYHPYENGGHSFSEGICTVCSIPEGLKYSLVKSPAHIEITDYTGDAQQLVIPAKIEGLPVTSIGDYAFRGCTSLTSVLIPDSVTSIGNSAFYGCTSLITVTIGDGATSIGNSAFCGCSNLTSVTIGNGVTSIDGGMFRRCTGLTEIHISEQNNAYASDALGIVYSKDMTTLILCPEGFTGAYTILDGTTSVAENAFYSCKKLTDITMPASLTEIGSSAFYSCTGLTHVTLGSAVTQVGNSAFSFCGLLTGVTIPDGMTHIGASAFGYCSALTEIVIPDSVTTLGDYAFEACSALYTVSLGSGLTNLEKGTFEGCAALTQLSLGENITSIGTYVFSGCSSLNNVTIPAGVTEIKYRTFYGCTNLVWIAIPEKLTDIADDAFRNCRSLCHVLYAGTEEQWSAVNVPDYGNTTFINAYRHYAAAGNEVDIRETCGGYYAFCSLCDRGVGYLPEEGKTHSFAECVCTGCGVPEYLSYSITNTTGDVTVTGFDGSVSSIEIPATIEQLPVVSVGADAFKNQRSLVNVTLGENVQTLGTNAFAGCHSLANVSFGTGLMEIERAAFYECPQLTHVVCGGTRAQWNQITVDLDNLTILDATVHYNASPDVVCWKGSGDYAYLYCTLCEAALTQGCGHEQTECTDAAEPTCTEPGYTGDTYCTICGEQLSAGESIAALGHEYEDGSCVRCGAAEEKPDQPMYNPFEDVEDSAYYAAPVLWAVAEGVTNGTSPTEFSPQAPCTRGQIVTFLWRAFGSPEPTSTENPFTDVPEHMYYYKAVLWAVEQGITTGTSATTFSPESTCTRGQVATFLWRACDKPAPDSASNPFSDVSGAMYYYEPIIWAVEQGITNGTGNGMFSPEDSCTRGQIVTFLYRALAKE